MCACICVCVRCFTFVISFFSNSKSNMRLHSLSLFTLVQRLEVGMAQRLVHTDALVGVEHQHLVQQIQR